MPAVTTVTLSSHNYSIHQSLIDPDIYPIYMALINASRRDDAHECVDSQIIRNQQAILKLLTNLSTQGTKLMATMAELAAAVHANTPVIEELLALIKDIKAKLDAAIAANDPAALQALSDELAAEDAKAQAVIDANKAASP